ncbi:uncharacterized protein LOC105425113 [Pogonomyrmex barbatus]|uniref:Uncharacterized protein LOC105425113 n=1 Tax=Pogonomyrmex barbatus TaxID=144034 RepID=A0A6I9WQB9_9HYME|nr:uncharacterized protein LOC105425113 [Pogonomyrmex barbatus]
MIDRKNAAFDYSEDCVNECKRSIPFESQYNAASFRIPFRINWTIVLIVIVSILVCQFAESVAEQVSNSRGKTNYDQHCLERNARRSMTSGQSLRRSIANDAPPLTSEDILSRLEAAAALRDNLVTALGRILLLCLDEDTRVPFERIHDAVRNRRVAAYEFLHVLPALRNKLPKQQLYKLLQILERVDNRFVSEYASLCLNAFLNVNTAVVPLADMLRNVDPNVIESISHEQRNGIAPSLTKDVDFLLQTARDGNQIFDLRAVSAILLNYPAFDLTDPEVHGAIKFIAQRMKERSSSTEDTLLRYLGPNLENPMDLLKTVLERLEADEFSSDTIREAASLLLQNFNVEPYSTKRKNDWKNLLKVTNDYYPTNAVAVAKYLLDHLNNSDIQDLDIDFYETGDHALLQVLTRLRRKPHLQHLEKPLSFLIPFVSQKLASDANYDYTAPISFYEINDYLNSFETPCLQQNISNAMKTLRPYLSKDLPWTYAFGDRRVNDDPWELILTSLTRLRNVPVSKLLANAVDNFVYKSHIYGLTRERESLYDAGVIFQRDDSTNVEVDFFSLLINEIPNVFKSDKFTPMLNFLSKPNVLNILGYEFNKFEHETPRSLLLAVLKRALALPLVKSDGSLFAALQNANNYLEELLLINLYTSENLQLLLKYLPHIDSDSRYLPLKILFKKQKLFTYLSSTFSLVDVDTPIERLLLILQTVGLKTAEPKLSEALRFALDNINGPPLPIKIFDRSDFIYLIQQLLSRNKTLQDEILQSYAYVNVTDWNISISGTPENVLVRALNYPVFYISSDGNLADLVKRAENILERKIVFHILKRQTLEAMLEYLPNNTYVKPVILLLKKADLMTLVPNLNPAILESATPRNALIILLKSLAESYVIRTEKLLLRHIRATLSFLDGANEDENHQTPIFAYLIQSLQDPSNASYQSLLREISQLQNPTILPEEREAWLQNYFQQIIAKNQTEANVASVILKEITYDKYLDEASRASKKRINKAVSFLPADSFTEPLRKLLTPDWAYSILPEELRNSDLLEKEELLLAILYHTKQRIDVANNLSLMKIISKIETNLKGWRMNIQPLRNAVAATKAAVYDPVKKLLSAAELNKIGITIPFGRSAKLSLLGLLHRLLSHPIIKKSDKVFKLLNIIRQDIFSLGIDVDLLTIFDNAGIAYSSELAPIRLFLHRKDINEKFGRAIFAITNIQRRYRALLKLLHKHHEMGNSTQFLNAFSMLRNIRPDEGLAGTQISDLEDIVNTIPHIVRQRFRSIEKLLNADVLSRFTNDDSIVRSQTPLITLLSKIANLSEVRNNHTAANILNKLRSEVEHLNHPIVTGFQLRPLLLEMEHVRQINVDYLNSILNPEVLSYLNPEKLFNMPNSEILRNIVDYLLNEGPAYVDYNMQKQLQSFKRALELTIGPEKKEDLTTEDWEEMLALIPHKKDFVPIKIFLQSKEIAKYIQYKDTNWKMFPTPVKKLLYLLFLIKNKYKIENENVNESANKLKKNLENRFYFITEEDIKNMHRTLMSLKLNYNVVPLKIFLSHDNMIKYLPQDFKYTNYSTSIDAFTAVLDNLLRLPTLRRRVTLYKTMRFVRQSLQISSTRRSFQEIPKKLSSKDLELITILNMSPKLREFLKSENLTGLLPESFTFDNQPTYKTKTLHLLRQLLKLNTDVHSELEGLVQEVETYPDVPDITEDDLVPLLNIIPVTGMPYLELIRKYLKSYTLIKMLPGKFDIKQASTVRVALHDVLRMLNATLGSTKNDKLQDTLNVLVGELTKVSSEIIPLSSIVNSDDIRSIINEIPFNQYNQIKQLRTQMTTKKVIMSLPVNFQLTEYKTKKLRVLAVLGELSKSNAFLSLAYSINFAKRIVSKMPDTPAVNDTEIEKLLLPLPLDTFYIKLLVNNCRLATLMPYLPIHFNISSIESRKMKISTIVHYCQQANPTDVSTRQALINAGTLLKKMSDIDITREHVDVLIRAIPCTYFSSISPLLQFLSTTDVASLLPIDLDLYRPSRTFKQRIFDLLSALRNVKELHNDKIFSALDSLETNAKFLPEQVSIPQDLNRLSVLANSASCIKYQDFALKSENLVQILPPNYSFQSIFTRNSNETPSRNYTEWISIMHFSALFLRDVKVDGPMKDAFEACKNDMRRVGKEIFLYHAFVPFIPNGRCANEVKPLKLYMLGHKEDLAVEDLPKDIYRAFSHGTPFGMVRAVMRELAYRSELIKSKSLINDIEVYLHDCIMSAFRTWIPSFDRSIVIQEVPTFSEIDEAINEIPSDHEFDNLRLLMQCQDTQVLILEKNLMPRDTPKQLLLKMMELVEKRDISEAMRQSIKTLKPHLVNEIHKEQVEHAMKQMRDYRYHASKLQTIRKYFTLWGFQLLYGNDFDIKYSTYKSMLFAMNDLMLNLTISRPTDFAPEYHTESKYLNRTLHNEMKIERMINERTINDIDLHSLLFALPKTTDEGIIRGIIKFFSIPDLLRKLKLPKDPFEYVTKGRLLQAILDLGQELESVQQDPVQQEALGYFRDKITTIDGLDAPIELKKHAKDSNVNVDMYGVMRALDYSKINETDAVKVAMFFERKYNNLVHAAGFDHMTYTTRGAYLKALFEHLIKVPQVPDDVKQHITSLLPAVRLDGPGDESVDLNADIVHEEMPSMRFGEFLDTKSLTPVARFETSDTFQENKESLKSAIDDLLLTISLAEEEHLDKISGQSNVYKDKTRVVIEVPQHIHLHDTRRNLNPINLRMQDTNNFNKIISIKIKNLAETKKTIGQET